MAKEQSALSEAPGREQAGQHLVHLMEVRHHPGERADPERRGEGRPAKPPSPPAEIGFRKDRRNAHQDRDAGKRPHGIDAVERRIHPLGGVGRTDRSHRGDQKSHQHQLQPVRSHRLRGRHRGIQDAELLTLQALLRRGRRKLCVLSGREGYADRADGS